MNEDVGKQSINVRIQGCSACLSGLGSQERHELFASEIKNTKFVLGSFSARYILKKKKKKR